MYCNQCHRTMALVNFLVSKIRGLCLMKLSSKKLFYFLLNKSLEVALVNFHTDWRTWLSSITKGRKRTNLAQIYITQVMNYNLGYDL